MTVWITGIEGMLGSEVGKIFQRLGGYRVLGTRRRDCDIANLASVASAIQRIQPDIIINCAGIVKGRNIPASEFMRTNALGPQMLSEMADLWGARLIQISTASVFSGTIRPQQRYSEVMEPNPKGTYGRSMLAGEVTREPHLTIRTSFVGIGERGLLSWLMQQEGEVTGYDRSFWNGVTVPIMAEILYGLSQTPLSGVLHVHSGKGITKHCLLELLVKAFDLPLVVKKGPTPIDHHVNHCLSSHRLAALPLEIPPIEAQIQHLADSYNEWVAAQKLAFSKTQENGGQALPSLDQVPEVAEVPA